MTRQAKPRIRKSSPKAAPARPAVAKSQTHSAGSEGYAKTYELPAPKGRITVAVKIIDMLGEEVLSLLTV